MAGTEYAHELGRMLESASGAEERIGLSRLLAATGSPDAQGYLLDALADETDERVITALRAALADLDVALGRRSCE